MSLELSPPDQTYTGSLRPLLMRFFPVLLLLASYGTIMAEKTSRMYWPYMISTYVIASLVFILYEAKRAREEPLPTLGNYLFSRDMWLHRSAVQDYGLFLINYFILFWLSDHFIFTLQNTDQIFKNFSGLIFNASQALHIPQHPGHAGWGPMLLYTFFTLMFAELLLYTWHRTMHRVPVLWQFHKVHHSAEVMTPLTYIRAHPIDLWVQNFLRIATIGIASGLFYYLYPNMQSMWMIAEVDVLLFVFYILGANLHHSHVWFSYGPLERFFISPAQHQIHHSTQRRHYDKNFGSMIAFWDWIFGTLYMVKEREEIKFGLTGAEREHCQTLWSMYIHPFKNLWKVIIK